MTVRSEDGATRFEEGKDGHSRRSTIRSSIRGGGIRRRFRCGCCRGGRLRDGQRVRVSWYHSLLIHDSQVTVCMAEPALDHLFFDHAGGWWPNGCDRGRFCSTWTRSGWGHLRGLGTRNPAPVAGRLRDSSGDRAAAARAGRAGGDLVRHVRPGTQRAAGTITSWRAISRGSWKHTPEAHPPHRGLGGGAPRPKSLRFFADAGFDTFGGVLLRLGEPRRGEGLDRGGAGVPRTRFMVSVGKEVRPAAGVRRTCSGGWIDEPVGRITSPASRRRPGSG